MIWIALTLSLFSCLVLTWLAIEYVRCPITKLRQSLKVLSPSLRVEREYGLATADYVDPKTLPGYFTLALLFHEDDLFFEHHGFNWREIRNRIKAAVRSGAKPKGGSSISQQLVRFVFLHRNRSWLRKLKEAVYCIKLEQNFSKDEILGLYISSIRWGIGTIGLGRASKLYFSKDPASLTFLDAMILAAAPPAPHRLEQDLLIQGNISKFNYRNALYKFSDIFRFIYKEFGAESLSNFDSISYAQIKEKLREFRKYTPLGLDQKIESAIFFHSIRALELLRQRLVRLPLEPNWYNDHRILSLSEEELVILDLFAGKTFDHVNNDPSRLDWGRIRQQVANHNIIPQILISVAMGNSEAAQQEASLLGPLREKNNLLNLRLTNMLACVSRALESAELKFIVIKGPALAIDYYGDLCARHFRDLDIWIDESSSARYFAALSEAGFVPVYDFASAHHNVSVRYDRALEFTNKEGCRLDVHLDLTERRFPRILGFDEAWQRAQVVCLSPDSIQIKVLAPEDNLFFLSLHAAKHCFSKLCWISDVAKLIETKEIDWPRLLSRARAMNVYTLMMVSIGLAAQVQKAKLPDGIAEKIQLDLELREGQIWAIRNLFRSRAGVREIYMNLDFQCWLFDNYYMKFKLIFWRIFGPSHADVGKINCSYSLFLIMMRIFRVTRKAFVGALSYE